MSDAPEQALSYLRAMVDEGAEFRPGQFEAIQALLDGRRVLVVQRTGWGKSAVYFIGTRLLRNRGTGPTLLVSPLLALMRNQIDMATRLGVRAETINSSNQAEWERVERAIQADEVDLLLVSPERLNNPQFRSEVLPTVAASTGLLVVDEAHCISDWGHDFRPDYRRLVRVLEQLPSGVPVLCTTATANDRVIQDVVEQLGTEMDVFRGPLDRDSLVLDVIDLPLQSQRLAWLANVIPELPGSGIVYCLTIRDTLRVASWLLSQGISAAAYSGDTAPEERERIEAELIADELKVVVATSALGMGFDKPNLAFVIHYQAPGSPIAYYQQIGRAGREIDRADVILLRGEEDVEIQDYFIKTAFPPRAQAEGIIDLLAAEARPLTVDEMLAQVNVRKSRLEAMLKILEVEGAVERVGRGWRRTLARWSYDEGRVSRVTEARLKEQRSMREYAETDGCYMQFLRERLDDPEAGVCARCSNDTGERMVIDLSEKVRTAADEHLRGSTVVLEPRKMWPPGLGSPRGRIDPDHVLEEGRALSTYNDGGWGSLVRKEKMAGGPFSGRLVRLSTTLIRDRWKPVPFPTWLTCVPSRSHPDLVPAFARQLADALGISFLPVVEKMRDNKPQKLMENSARQALNVLGAFSVAGEVPPEPVFLVDDISDSRWTLTTIGGELRKAGSGPVFPFVLSTAVSM